MILLSFVIPCYRSEFTIKKVIDEIRDTVAQKSETYDYEIIAVNDCSPDGVYDVLKGLAAGDKKIKLVNFAKNMGKHAAVLAGYSVAKGEYIVNLDDDFQSPVYGLYELMAKFDEGYDVVMADYPQKKESAFKKFGSAVNSWMIRFLLDKPKGLTFENFSVMKKFVTDEMIKYTHPYPFLEGLMLRTTRNIATVTIEERDRGDDRSTGYTFIKSLQLMINGLTAFSVKPLRIATFMGLLFSVIGFIFGLVTIIRKIIHVNTVLGYSSLMAVLLFVGGLILLMLGLIGEYLGRIYICINASPQYIIKETVNCSPAQVKDSETDTGR